MSQETSPNRPDVPTKLMPSAHTPKVVFGLDENIAATLCYALSWVSGVIFLFAERANRIVRFHAWQSIVIFLPLQIALTLSFLARSLFGDLAVRFVLMTLGGGFSIFSVFLWIKLMIAAYQEDDYQAPLVGKLIAARVLREEDTRRRKK